MKFNEILPVGISITVLILVALIQRQSKVVAAVTATMPVTIPLVLSALFILLQKGNGNRSERFTGGLVSGIIPTVAFVVAIWLSTRLGLKLVPTLLMSYLTWGLTLGVAAHGTPLDGDLTSGHLQPPSGFQDPGGVQRDPTPGFLVDLPGCPRCAG